MASSTKARRDWIGSAIDQYQGRLIRFASRITGDVESARDVVQDTFLRLCREDLDHVRDHLPAWLFRVCRNRALDVRKKERPLQALDDDGAAALEEAGADPHVRLEKGDDARRLLAAVGLLPAAQQEVLRLRFQEELSYKEISGVTGHSVGSVGFLIHDGIKKLRARLRPEAPAPRPEGERADA
ncbi:MAG TPA: sigma-70 family RNA polymerase sigma factor [Vicinamibacteria bacterium]|nr:sigma-70 family RNA polymerase sigma factor [Vicinamibacteria bacterium]